MKSSLVLFWLFCVLDGLCALFTLFFLTSKSLANGIGNTLLFYFLSTAAAVLWANQLRHSGRPVGAVLVAAVPALLAIAVATLVYMSLKDGIRQF